MYNPIDLRVEVTDTRDEILFCSYALSFSSDIKQHNLRLTFARSVKGTLVLTDVDIQSRNINEKTKQNRTSVVVKHASEGRLIRSM